MKLNLETIKSIFAENNINYSEPGFYDNSAFLKCENENPRFLELYADYIITKSYTEEYLQYVKEIVPKIANFLYKELKKDGRKGACIDINQTFLRILEEEKIWAYQITGSLAILINNNNLTTTFVVFSPINLNQKCGHSWLCVPPFKIIDISLYMQDYPPQVQKLIPDSYIIKEQVEILDSNKITSEFIIDPDCIEYMTKIDGRFSNPPTLKEVQEFINKPELFEHIDNYGAFLYQPNQFVNAIYISLGITAPDSPLKEMKNLCLSGKYPLDLYYEYLKTHKSN